MFLFAFVMFLFAFVSLGKEHCEWVSREYREHTAIRSHQGQQTVDFSPAFRVDIQRDLEGRRTFSVFRESAQVAVDVASDFAREVQETKDRPDIICVSHIDNRRKISFGEKGEWT
jgi:hypothetical protein